MEKQGRLDRSIAIVALITGLILMVPLIAMQFSEEVDWSLPDFMVMGVLIFGIGLSYVLLSRRSPNMVYKMAMAVALGSTFLMIWANLAVGLIGSGPNAANLMYGGVVFVVIIGIILSGFSAAGMERAMYATTLSLALVTAIAFLADMHHAPGSSASEIMTMGGFLGGLYLVSASMFRHVVRNGPASRRVQ